MKQKLEWEIGRMNELFIRSVKLNKDKQGLDDYLSALPAVKNLNCLELSKSVTFLAGENRTGKSTLLEAIAVNMDDDPETLEYIDYDSFDVVQERFVALQDIFPIYDNVLYEYDFGDSWEHTITLEKSLKANVLRATYLDGDGERPLEDVGGSWGYQEYRRIMEDDTDPEYANMKMWAESQKEKKRDPEEINARLKDVISGHRYYSYKNIVDSYQ